MKSLHYIALLTVLLGLASCTVKEDRIECPVYLHFDKVGNPYGCDGDAAVYGFTKQGSVLDFQYTGALGLLLSDEQTVPLSKGVGMVTMMIPEGTAVGTVNTSREYLIPEGRQMDRIYALHDMFETREDDYHVRGSLLRQFADVTLSMSYLEGKPCPFVLKVKGPSAGFSVKNLSPVEGKYSLSPEAEPDGTYRFRLPRQNAGDKLYLLLYGAGAGASAAPLHTILLSEYLDRAGYDWTADDLASIALDIDYTRCTVTVTVADWDYVFDLMFEL